jgi:tetratricopeptide (TPR) repeat protein
MRTPRAWQVLAVCCLLAPPVRADPRGAVDRPQAERACVDGRRLYDLGEYRGALEAFKKAYLLSESPALLYNIGRCYEQLGERRLAIERYRTFLALSPDTPDRVSVEQRIASLDGTIARQSGTRYPVAVPAAVGALGAAALIVGGTLYGVSGSQYDALISDGCGNATVCNADRWNGTRRMEQAGIGLLIAGGGLVGVDLVLWGLWRKRRR